MSTKVTHHISYHIHLPGIKGLFEQSYTQSGGTFHTFADVQTEL